MPIEAILALTDRDGLEMNVHINYQCVLFPCSHSLGELVRSKYPQSGGAMKIQLFSPYAFINKTGLDFSLRTKAPISSAKNVAGMRIYTGALSRTAKGAS